MKSLSIREILKRTELDPYQKLVLVVKGKELQLTEENKLKINELLGLIHRPRHGAEVISLRFGLRDGRWRTLKEVRNELFQTTWWNVTKGRIRQVEAITIYHLRHSSKSRYFPN